VTPAPPKIYHPHFLHLCIFCGIITRMIDKQKVHNIIEKILKENSGFQNGHWSSSQDFETELKKRGFVPPIEIWHQYKFPHGFDEESFEQYVLLQSYIHLFDSDEILNPERYTKKFFSGSTVPEQEQQNYLADLNKRVAQLTDEEKKYVVKYFLDEQSRALSNLTQFLPELRLLNPEIKDIKINTQSIFDVSDLYIGMTSRFHPEDIAYFCSLADHEPAIKEQDKKMSAIGVWSNFLMAPHRIQKLVDGIIIQKRKFIEKVAGK